MKHSYLGFRFSIFFSGLTKSYKHPSSKGTIYINDNSIICSDFSFFFAKFVISLFFPQPPLVFLMSTSIMWRVKFQLWKILFFWARFRTCHEGFGTKSYNLVLFWSLCLFLLTICRHWSTIISTFADTFLPTGSHSIYVQVLSCRLFARNGRHWPELHLLNVDDTQQVFKLTLVALDCLGSTISDIVQTFFILFSRKKYSNFVDSWCCLIW